MCFLFLVLSVSFSLSLPSSYQYTVLFFFSTFYKFPFPHSVFLFLLPFFLYWSTYQTLLQGIDNNLENHIGPDDMQHKQHQEQRVEDIISWEHGQNAWCLYRGAAKRTEEKSCKLMSLYLLQFD